MRQQLKVELKLKTHAEITLVYSMLCWMFLCRKEAFLNFKDNVAVTEASLKHGFQWLREQVAVDTVVIDNKTNASFLEYLVFKYDLLAEYSVFQLVCNNFELLIFLSTQYAEGYFSCCYFLSDRCFLTLMLSCVNQSHPVSMMHCTQPTESIITQSMLQNSSELQFSCTKDLDEMKL